MDRIVVYHDQPIAQSLRAGRRDFDIVATEDVEGTRRALREANILITNPSGWSDTYLDSLDAGDWVQTTSVGYAAFPVETFEDFGIGFSNTATLYDSTVSEHAFALAFVLSRNIRQFIVQAEERQWDREAASDSWDWKGKRLLVFGLGNIGEAIARRGQAFGLNVFGVKRVPSTYTGCLSQNSVYGPTDFQDLLPETDLLIVTVPLTQKTHHAIDRLVFSELPDSAVLVNVARGPVINEEALLEALQEGQIRAAGLDVFESEPLADDSQLWNRDDVVITPHVAGRSTDFSERFIGLFVENYRRWKNGEQLVNRVV